MVSTVVHVLSLRSERDHWPGTIGIYGLHQPSNHTKADRCILVLWSSADAPSFEYQFQSFRVTENVAEKIGFS
ncbi:hypothetical protein GUJ93_ZPchr0013g35996 [Zizania palustris]|uniref:Uncharacterized protein n=1 Tax=Zizania palustris TaxID=103762 RepID=A0A8J5X243_ZIZPA|nr:hypothetical protein GUJ93_ZPchr0013g35996 [Zizania palustris]